ncbi:MAG: redoxin domain-containing protein [Holosporales bacterium]|nr:redoxin domain-containing protein [Holosporales bacterium]
MRVFVTAAVVLLSVSMHGAQAQQNQVYQAMAGTSPQQQGEQLQRESTSNASGVTSNKFLEYYSKQGADVSVSGFFMTPAGLAKRNLSSSDLKKAVIVFFGDWCPHCERFLGRFSGQLHRLTKKGIKIIFIGVPSVETLKKEWKDPTNEEYKVYASKLQNHNIKIADNVMLCALGDRVTLGRESIEGLPAVLAVKDGKEQYRGVGQDGLEKLDLSRDNILEQFLAIWDDNKGKDEDKSEKQEESKEKRGGKKQKAGGATRWKAGGGRSVVNRAKASAATEALNGDFDFCRQFINKSEAPFTVPQQQTQSPDSCWPQGTSVDSRVQEPAAEQPQSQDACERVPRTYRCGRK